MMLYTPTISLFYCSRLRGLANTGAETAFSAEAVLAAINDEVLHPTPLQWNQEAGKRSKDAEQLDIDLPEDVWVWPNPASHSLYVQAKEPGQLILTNVSGAQVLSTSVGAGAQTIDISALPAGYYVGTLLQQDGQRKHTSIIITR